MIDFDIDFSVTESGRRAPKYTLQSDLNGNVSLEDLFDFCRSSLVIISTEALKEEQGRGFDKKPVRTVDGVIGRSEFQVKPFGRIEYNARANSNQVISEIFEGIISRSPLDTGTYLFNNAVFVNGSFVASTRDELRKYFTTNELKPQDIVRFVNLTPYAGRLEKLGVTAQRQSARNVLSRDRRKRGAGIRIQAPNGTYFLTARAAQRKYQNNANIRFEFLPGTSFGLSRLPTSSRAGKVLRTVFSPKNPKYKGAYVYPCIRVQLSKGGVL